ncbi:hypothetical protein C7974DRAFT_389858, partial [Boeremia exigua]|uniref:uncharacterized protein n=1 Tax=Boeremia exigua TaxID=749465 RepID=UPI001E8CDF01
MRRPPIACQRAVQSLQAPASQHIWVPDEVLSLAVNRFFHRTCPQQKRHGSSVPGPLEARKRAAKRRMTASAGYSPQESFPASFTLGALFGYRSKPQHSWRYEPPSLPTDAPLWNIPPPIGVNDQSDEVRPTDVSSIEHGVPLSLAHQFRTPAETHEDSIDFEPVSQSLSNAQANGHTSVADDLEQCLEGFKATFVAPQGGLHGLSMREAFEQHLPATPFLWKYYTAVLQYVRQTGCNADPVLKCLLRQDGRLLRIVNPLQSINECAEFMDCLDLTSKRASGRRIFRIIAEMAGEFRRSSTEAHDIMLLRLIEHTGLQVPHTDSKEVAAATTMLLNALALKLSESVENKILLSHFAQPAKVRGVILSTVDSAADEDGSFASAERALFYMPRQQLLALVPDITSRLVNPTRGKHYSADSLNTYRLEKWFRLLHQVDIKANTDNALLNAVLVSLAKAMYHHDTKPMVPAEYFVKALLLHQHLDGQMLSPANEPRRVQTLFADVLLQMQAQPEQYTAFLNLALPLIAKHAGLHVLLCCLQTMNKQKLPLSTQMNFDSFIADRIAVLHTSTAKLAESQIQKRAFALQACEKLLHVLSRMGCALPARTKEVATLSGTRQFNNVLVHARDNHALPIVYRDLTADISLMERVALVHQLAHHYAQDTTRSHREVWRSIYYLYKFLLSNSLPIGPLFTKAVVHSSITRPLLENRFVSARRLIWVCHLVARVEGNEVAAQVEKRFFVWRGDLIGRAKRVYVSVGGSKHDHAHVGTMKRLGL